MKFLSAVSACSLLASCCEIRVHPQGVGAVLVNEVARRQLFRYAEPGSSWPRIDVPMLEVGSLKISSAFHVEEEKLDETVEKLRQLQPEGWHLGFNSRLSLQGFYLQATVRF
jgi:hypothetical protein